MGAVVLDSSVLIGLISPADAHHDIASKEIASARRAGGDFLLPATVLSEVMVGRIRYSPRTAPARQRDILILFGPVRIVDEDVALQAARLRAAHPALRLPDALVIATGVVDDAAVLTCDDRLAKVDPRVQVIRA